MSDEQPPRLLSVGIEDPEVLGDDAIALSGDANVGGNTQAVNVNRTTKLFDKPVRGLQLDPWTPNEYPQWKKSVEWTFDINNMLNILEGTEPCPEATTEQALIDDWAKRNKFACQALLSCVKGVTKTHLLQYKLASQMWAALDTLHAQRNSIRLSDLEDQLKELRVQPGQSIDSHIEAFERLHNLIDANSKNPMEKDIVNIRFLKSLGPGWRQFHQNNIANISVWEPTFLFEQVRAFLGNVELAPSSIATAPSATESPQAQANVTNYASKGKKGKKGGRGRGENKGDNNFVRVSGELLEPGVVVVVCLPSNGEP